MAAKILDGKKVADSIKNDIRKKIAENKVLGKPRPGLAVILIGKDPASSIYVRNKQQACQDVGIYSEFHPFEENVAEQVLINCIHELNQNSAIHGILLQLPLPKHIRTDDVLELIDPKKDVDGFHPYNLGRLAQRRPLLRPCTPFGIITLLEAYNVELRGKHAVIIGTSLIVGRPMALEFLMVGATVTICHKLTPNLAQYVSKADILVSAVGKPGLIQSDWFKKDAIAIDVGITRQADGSVSGDINPEATHQCAYLTPVPGGVGPMTVAMLLSNTLIAQDLQS